MTRCRFARMEEARLQEAPKLTLEAQFRLHVAACPDLPRPFLPNSPEAVEWYWLFWDWVKVKAKLEAKLKTRHLRFDKWGRLTRTEGAA